MQIVILNITRKVKLWKSLNGSLAIGENLSNKTSIHNDKSRLQ